MVKNHIFAFLSQRQSSILSGAVIIMAMVALSKILGLVRDRLLAHSFSPDTVAIFFAAFRWPDLIFQLLVLGALSVAFIPVFTEYLESHQRKEAFALVQSILTVVFLTLSAVTALIFIFAQPLTALIVPGFSHSQQVQVTLLTRVILIGQIILMVGSLFIAILQSFQRFIIPALAGVFYNLGIILGIIILSPTLGILGPAVGVVLGALLHVMIQLPLVISLGFRLKFQEKFLHPGVKEVIRLMSVRTIGLAAEQINETVGLILASLISAASVTYLTFAQHLQVVPIGLFGATIAQAALPVLSSEKARGNLVEFRLTLLTTLHQILFLVLPATAILIVLRIPAVRLVFGASQFDWPSTVITGKTLAFLAIGLFSQAISLLLVRGFYALKDTKTPVVISLVVVFLNVVLSVYFVKGLHLEVWSLGLANSVSALLSGALLFIALHFKVGEFNFNQVLRPSLKMILATAIMALALYIPVKLLDQVIFDTTRTVNLIILTGLAATFAIFIYIVLVWFLQVEELKTYLDLIKKIGKWQTLIKSKEIIHEPETV